MATFGDFDGDGRSDRISIDDTGCIWISISNGDRLTAPQRWSQGVAGVSDWLLGDFDGDGRTDVLGGGNDHGTMFVLLARDHALTLADGWTYSVVDEGAVSLVPGADVLSDPPDPPAPLPSDRAMVAGDFNGDGRSDLLVAREDGGGVDALLSDGSGFVRTRWSDVSPSDLASWQVGDFDGDGTDDILHSSVRGSDVLISGGQTFESAVRWTVAGLMEGTNWTVGDFDGDGRDDLFRYNPFALDGDVFLSNGQGFYGGGNWSPLSRMTVNELASLDLDGDGRAELDVGNGLVLANTDFDFAVRKMEGEDDPTTVRIPKVMVAGQAFTLEVDRGDRYDCTVYDPSTGEVLVYIASLAPSTRIVLDEDFTPGRFYEIRLNGIGDSSVSMTTSFRVISKDAAVEVSGSLDRFEIEHRGNEARPFFDDNEWKADVHSFADLTDRFDALFASVVATQKGGSSEQMAKALFLMQCVNQMWGYGNPVEPTLPGRLIQNEAFAIASLDDITFDLYLNGSIADCQDFAALTAFALTRSGIENRIVLTTGHVFNEAFVDGGWIVLDATLNISYDRSYAEVLDSSVGTRLLDFGRASAVQGSPRYRDLISDLYSRKVLFDAAGFASDPRVMSLDDFYDYIPDGFVYREALGGHLQPGAFEPMAIDHSYRLEALAFDDFYNHIAAFERFEVATVPAPTRAAIPFEDPDDLALALALAIDNLASANPLTRVVTLAGTARAHWDIAAQGTDGLLPSLAAAYQAEGFTIRSIEAAGTSFLELTRGDAAFVVDPTLGAIYSGRFGDVLRAGHLPVTVLTDSDDEVDAIAFMPAGDALLDNFLKIQLGAFADYAATPLHHWSAAQQIAAVDLAGTIATEELRATEGNTHLRDEAGGDDRLIGGNSADTLEIVRSSTQPASSVLLDGRADADLIRFAATDGRHAVAAIGGDGDDRIEIAGAVVAAIDGGDGDDFVVVRNAAGASADISGDAGADRLYVSGGGAATIDAGDGDDVVHVGLGSGSIIARLGSGVDRIVLHADQTTAVAEPLVVRDFALGSNGDRLDVGALLSGLPEAVRLDPFASGHLRLVAIEAGTALLLDRGGGDRAVQSLAIFDGISPDEFNPINLGGLATGVTRRGTQVADTLVGGDLSDILSGGDGNDNLDGDAGADLMEGGAGDDYFHVDHARDVIVEAAAGGSDTIVTTLLAFNLADSPFVERLVYAGTGDFVGRGSDAADAIVGNVGDDRLYGEGGDDVLDGGGGRDLLDGGVGNDAVVLSASRSGVVLETAEDGLRLVAPDGTSRLIAIEALVLSDGVFDIRTDGRLAERPRDVRTLTSGDDIVTGGDSDDSLTGGDGDDNLRGEEGNDLLLGGNGRDRLYGGEGNDRLSGGAQGDVLIGGRGADALDGADDDDYLNGEDDEDILDGGAGNDQILGGGGLDLLDGGSGDDRLDGGEGDDRLLGNAGRDILLGASGADTIEGGDDDDYLAGGDDGDRLDGGNGSDHLFGGQGDDALAGAANADWLDGGDGDDVAEGGDGADAVMGGNGADVLGGGTGDDYLSGGDGSDILAGGEGDDQLLGDIGDDHLSGNDGFDWLDGGIGDDLLDGDAGRDVLIGRAGNDLLRGGDDDDYLNGGDGGDALSGGLGDDQLFGGADDDRLGGGRGSDWIEGEAGDDRLVGDDGNDVVIGGTGADVAEGGSGDDYLNGGIGNDVLEGDDGADQLFGEAGADALSGGNGIDRLDGGADDDLLRGGAGGDVLIGRDGEDRLEGGDDDDYLHGGAGADTLFGEAGIDVLIGGDGKDVLEGGEQDDNLQGGADDDRLSGDAGDDILYGDQGDDVLAGGDGDDYLVGGGGADLLSGGAGADTFLFPAGGGSDVIQDLDATDRIGLAGFDDFAGLILHSRQEGVDVVIDLGDGETLTLLGLGVAEMDESSFFFL